MRGVAVTVQLLTGVQADHRFHQVTGQGLLLCALWLAGLAPMVRAGWRGVAPSAVTVVQAGLFAGAGLAMGLLAPGAGALPVGIYAVVAFSLLWLALPVRPSLRGLLGAPRRSRCWPRPWPCSPTPRRARRWSPSTCRAGRGCPGFLPLVTLLPPLYPDGRPVGPRWRWAVVTSTVGMALTAAGAAAYPQVFEGGTVPLEHPWTSSAVASALFPAGGVLCAVSLLAGVASLVVRLRRSTGLERRQVVVFLVAASAVVLSLGAWRLLPAPFGTVLQATAVGLLPVAVGIAVTRHQLYELDLAVCRLFYGERADPYAFLSTFNASLRARLDVPEVPAAVCDAAVRSLRLSSASCGCRGGHVHWRAPALDELGLAGSLRALGDRSRTPALQVLVDVPADLPTLPAATEVACYRIAAEALANAARHAGATSVHVRLAVGTDSVRLEVADDGRGLRSGSETGGSGLGLSSMRQRAEELGGTWTLDSSSDGTRVLVEVPR